jgi:hypothetical protein
MTGANESGLATPAAIIDHPSSRRRLVKWAVARTVLFVLLLLPGIAQWIQANADAQALRNLSATTSARVTRSDTVETGSGPSREYQLRVRVVFTPRGRRAPVMTTIEPSTLASVDRGQLLPIRYDPVQPGAAIYNGPGGDTQLLHAGVDATTPSGVQLNYAFAVFLLAAAVIFLLTGVRRWFRVVQAATHPGETETHAISSTMRRVRVYGARAGPDLEWRVLRGQSDVAGTAFVRGLVRPGRWLVVRLPDKRLIWPATRAQPVIGTGMPNVPHASASGLDVISTHRRLLAAYAQVLSQVDALPSITRRSPGRREDSSWWWLGAPRPVVRSLVAAHVRRRLRTLAAALTRAAVLGELDDSGGSRRTLNEASQECRALVDTLPRRAWPTVVVTLITTALTIYTAFFTTPHINVNGTSVDLVAGSIFSISLILGATPVLIFFRSIQCKRTLFNPATLNQKHTGSVSAESDEEWDIYRFEREAFLQAQVNEPREWEGQPWARYLIAVIYYGLVMAVPLVISIGPGGTGIVLGGLLLYFLILKSGFAALRDRRNGLATWWREYVKIAPSGTGTLYGYLFVLFILLRWILEGIRDPRSVLAAWWRELREGRHCEESPSACPRVASSIDGAAPCCDPGRYWSP